jgi:phosphohistidine phosphatase SixA
MKYVFNFILSLCLLIPTINSFAQDKTHANNVSTYYFIRHAEKEKSESPDPILHVDGKLRATKWSKIFNNISFDAIYSTDYNRTRNTALPSAQNKEIELTLYHPMNINIEKFLLETIGETILIVGHSNTIPAFVNKIIEKNKYQTIEEETYGNLYIVEITNNTITDKLLYLE